MADVQCENGYTKIANELLEAITRANFSSRELKVILAVIRFSYGFNKKACQISLRYLEKATNIRYQNLRKIIKQLCNKNVLKIENDYIGSKPREISINKNYDDWFVECNQKDYTKSNQKDYTKSNQKNYSRVIKTITNKENNKENINKEEDSFFINLIPESLIKRKGFIQVWKEWIEYRKSIKKKLTEFSVKKQLKFLELQPNPIEVINQSIRNQWQGLFPLKSNSNSYRETKNEINDRPKTLELKI
ncbi:MAG: replication protein [Melioribacter sp.]|uniref:replication protein n=1 Tax=Rosettibacter primus TaxID=3111523 RepID=UPI00247D3251|nr:replication protein [Melioribacter sp.]